MPGGPEYWEEDCGQVIRSWSCECASGAQCITFARWRFCAVGSLMCTHADYDLSTAATQSHWHSMWDRQCLLQSKRTHAYVVVVSSTAQLLEWCIFSCFKCDWFGLGLRKLENGNLPRTLLCALFGMVSSLSPFQKDFLAFVTKLEVTTASFPYALTLYCLEKTWEN